MRLDELRDKGYHFRVGLGSWSVYHGNVWTGRLVAKGKLKQIYVNEVPGRGVAFETLNKADRAAVKAAIGAAAADLVKRRVNGEIV